MPRIITFGREPIELGQKLEKQSLLDYLKSIFNSFDRFTKIQVVTVILLIIIAPSIVVSNFVFKGQAFLVPKIISPLTQTPLSGGNIKNKQTVQSTQITQLVAAQNYNVDVEILNVLNLINQYRVQNGLPVLTATRYLSDAAKWMSGDMAQKNYLSHYDTIRMTSQSNYTCDSVNPACCSLTNTTDTSNGGKCASRGYFCQGHCGGRLLSARLKFFGYNPSYTWTGENVGGGFTTSQDIFNAWKNSPEHNAVLLGKNYNAVGIGRAYNQSSSYGWYWAADFGTVKDTSGNILDTTVNYVAQLTPTPTPFCLLNCVTPTPTKAPTPTPTKAPTSSCTLGQQACGNVGTASSYPHYTNYGTTQYCNTSTGLFAGNPSCATGYYCTLTASYKASCIQGCTQRGYSCSSSCPASNIIPLGTNGYACPSGGTCCSVAGISTTPNPTTTPTPTIVSGCTNGYRDNDLDGYGTGAYGCYTGTVSSNSSDCCDQDNRAHPGALGYTSPNSCGSFDYNCSGSSTPTNAGGGSYYTYGGLTAYSYNNGSTCTNGTYTNNFYRSTSISITSANCGQNVTIQPCSYSYYLGTGCSGLIGYNLCTSRLIACN